MAKRPDLVLRNQQRAEQLKEKQLTNYYINDNGCWIWQGAIDTDGYGKLKRDQKTIRAHRFFYEYHKEKIPDGLLVCHHCDEPACVNPDHLFLGTHLENEQDKDRKGRRALSPSITHPHKVIRGENHCRSKLTNEDVLTIRASTDTSYELAEQYGVDASTIQRIWRRETWTHI